MNELAKYQPPAMPTVAKYGFDLDPEKWRDFLGQDVATIPEDDCRAIIAEIDASLLPAGSKTAAQFTRILLGSYPTRELTDPATFTSMIASVFETVPADIGVRAIDNVTRAVKFLPTRAEVHEACEALLGRRRLIQTIAKIHLARHASRAAGRIELPRGQESIYRGVV